MPMKLNVGLSRKVGEANYGSRGASVNLEQEVDATLINEPQRLQERIREMFRLAQEAVDEELHVEPPQPAANTQRSTGPAATASRQPHANGRNGASRSATTGYRSNGNGRQPANTPPPATASQVRALHAIANQQRLDLSALLRERFELDQPEKLTIAEASDLIDELKGTTSTSGGRR